MGGLCLPLFILIMSATFMIIIIIGVFGWGIVARRNRIDVGTIQWNAFPLLLKYFLFHLAGL